MHGAGLIRVCHPGELREDATIALQQLLVNLVVLADDAGSHVCLRDLVLHSLPCRMWSNVVRQAPNRLVVATAEGALEDIFLTVRILIEHRGQVWHLVVLDWSRPDRAPLERPSKLIRERAAILISDSINVAVVGTHEGANVAILA